MANKIAPVFYHIIDPRYHVKRHILPGVKMTVACLAATHRVVKVYPTRVCNRWCQVLEMQTQGEKYTQLYLGSALAYLVTCGVKG